MKLFGLGIIIIFFFVTTGSLSADKVYTWNDDAKVYIDTHDRKQYMRRAHKYEMKKKAGEAEAAVDQANAAAEKARKAAENAKLFQIALVGTAFTYFIAILVGRRVFSIDHLALLPNEANLHVALEEVLENIAHLYLVFTGIFSFFCISPKEQ